MIEAADVNTPSTSATKLDALSFPLWGSRLIEASAGTGKTWTIAALYLRLIIGHGSDATGFARALAPSEILVMTFTRAATRELSDRIRARLLEAARCFRGDEQPKPEDEYLRRLLAEYPASDPAARRTAAWRLAMAAECMDEAAIHTIDAWCSRMLREHAFDSGSPFDEELVADEDAMRMQAVQDYWRQQCYGLTREQLANVLQVWPDPDTLHADVKDLLGKDLDGKIVATASGQSLTEAMSSGSETLRELRAQWLARVPVMSAFVNSQNPPNQHGWDGRSFSIKHISGWLGTLKSWAESTSIEVLPDLRAGWNRLTPDGLGSARRTGAGPCVMPPAAAEAFGAFANLEATLRSLPNPRHVARLHAAAHVAQRLRQLKRDQGTFGFADMLERLDAALKGANGQRLRERIRAQFPVALVDEFQDSSPIQYSIFDQIYKAADNSSDHALLLIGDPKQSIYGFRGADIYSYLRARKATEGRHYALAVNYRSTEALVEAVNRAFRQAEQSHPERAFRFGTEKHNPVPFEAVSANGRKETWASTDGTPPAITLVHDLEPRSMTLARRALAERCAERIVAWLNDANNGFSQDGKPFQRLRPGDIAILVRTGKEAAATRRALQRRNLASVYLSDKESVYRSDEARDLAHWLRAVATPQDAVLVRAALALASVGLPLGELRRLATDDEYFDAQVEILRELRQTWIDRGVLAMLRQSLHRFRLAARWLAQDGGERRLTNFLHLAELLQGASNEVEGTQALIRWLSNQIAEDAESNDEQVVRLESDADLIKIVTVHKSKGLEYPVVCLPFATSFREFYSHRVKSALLPASDGVRELVLEFDEDAKERYRRERLREDLRLLYVAMTRPRHALWLGFAAVKVGNSDKCRTHDSAIGSLLGGGQPHDSQGWLNCLEMLAANCNDIALETAAGPAATTRLQPRDGLPALRPTPEYRHDFDRDWSIASYSRLTANLIEGAPDAPADPSQVAREVSPSVNALSPLQVTRAADDEDEAFGDAEDQPKVTANAVESRADAAAGPNPGPIWHTLRRGKTTGNFLHSQLEWLSSEGFALKGNDKLSARLRARCELDGYTDIAPELVRWLTDIVSTPLPALGVSLSELQTARAEMEFWLPVRDLDTDAVDSLCRQYLLPGVERPRLRTSTLHGMLTGFMDLVFEHDGRYWVLDYKGNGLGTDDSGYDAASLAAAMAKHRYDVQAAVYALALHRLLRSRLGSDYDPARHLGGAVYLFLRGIHGPAGGTCTLTIPPACLHALDAMLEPAPMLAS